MAQKEGRSLSPWNHVGARLQFRSLGRSLASGSLLLLLRRLDVQRLNKVRAGTLEAEAFQLLRHVLHLSMLGPQDGL